MSDLKPGTLVLLDHKEWPVTTEFDGLLWVFVREVASSDAMFRYECKSVATGIVHVFDRNSLTEYKEQTNAET